MPSLVHRPGPGASCASAGGRERYGEHGTAEHLQRVDDMWIAIGVIAALAAFSLTRAIRTLSAGISARQVLSGEFEHSLTGTLLAVFVLVRRRAALKPRDFPNQFVSGKFDDSSLGKEFAAWFAEDPAREAQREQFVRAALSLGYPPRRVGQRVGRCIIKAWKYPDQGFGNLAAAELDILVFEAPRDAIRAEDQKSVRLQVEGCKNDLRALDGVRAH